MNWLRDQIDKVVEWVGDLKEGQRRTLLAGLLVLAGIGFGFLIYWVFFRELFQEEKVNINGELVNVSQLPDILPNINGELINVNEIPTVLPEIDTIARGGNTLSQVIYDGNAQDATLSGDGKTLNYYDPQTGRFYKIDSNGNVEQLSDKVFKGVEQANWSEDGEKAVLELADGFNIAYDFNTEKQYTLNEKMEEFDFSPNANQISYKYIAENPDDRWLGVANFDGSGVVGVEHLGDNEETVNAQWSPSGQSVGTYEEGVNGEYNKVIPLGFRGENFKDITVKGRGFDYQWSPNGRQMLYSTYDADTEYNNTLYIVDSYGDDIGNNNTALNISTSVDKCSFNARGDAVYCAVPVDPPLGSAIDPTKLTNLQHDFYKIDLNSGVAAKIATPTDATGFTLKSPESVMITDQEDMLFYTETETGRIRRVLLK